MCKQKENYQQAVEDIERFLAHEYSYTEFMQGAAEAQAQLQIAFGIMNQSRLDEININAVGEFFFYAIRVMEILKPFARQIKSLESV